MKKDAFFLSFFLSLGIGLMLAGPVYGELKALTNDELSEVNAKAGPVNGRIFNDSEQSREIFREEYDFLGCTDPSSEACENAMDDSGFPGVTRALNQPPPQPYDRPTRFPACTSGGCGR